VGMVVVFKKIGTPARPAKQSSLLSYISCVDHDRHKSEGKRHHVQQYISVTL